MKVGVLALQGAFRRHLNAITALGASAVEVRDESALADVDAIVLPGGESTTMAMLLDSSGLTSPLRVRLQAGLPVLGTCAGMILLAHQILDGRPDQPSLDIVDIDVRRNAYGRQADSFEVDLAVDGIGEPPFHAVFIRAPGVERVGPEVEVLAAIDGRPVVCRQGPALVAAFHPELGDDPRLHALYLDLVTSSIS